MQENLLVEAHYDLIPFGVYVVNVKTLDIVFMNTIMREKRGNRAGEKCYRALFAQEEQCSFCRIGELIDKRGRPNGAAVVYEHFHEQDDRWYQMQEKAMGWYDGQVVKCSIAVDINELKETQNRLAEAHAQLALKNRDLERLAVTDRLTGIANRFRLDEVLLREMNRSDRYNTPLSLIIMDLDFFKRVNDTHGHQVGDLVLQQIAQLLGANIRSADLLGRWGGEEFLIICPGIDRDGATAMAEKLRKRIREHLFEHVRDQTASFGVAQYRQGESAEDIVRRADQALYRAKDLGRNRVEVGRP